MSKENKGVAVLIILLISLFWVLYCVGSYMWADVKAGIHSKIELKELKIKMLKLNIKKLNGECGNDFQVK